jgi:hypothetical protein
MKLTDKRILFTGADGFIDEVVNIDSGNEIFVGDHS